MWKTGTIDKDKTSDRCEMKAIFDGLNSWQVVKLETNKNNDIDEGELAKEILHGIESRIPENIMKGNYGAIKMDDPDIDKYHIVEWYFNVYTAQNDIVMKGYNPPKYTYVGEMEWKTGLWNLVMK